MVFFASLAPLLHNRKTKKNMIKKRRRLKCLSIAISLRLPFGSIMIIDSDAREKGSTRSKLLRKIIDDYVQKSMLEQFKTNDKKGI